MANEVQIVTLLNHGNVINLKCANSIGITKGAILAIEKEGYVSGAVSVAAGQYPIGIAAASKEASDGATTIGVYTEGIFRGKLNTDAVSCGQMVTISGANLLGLCKSGANQALILGRALEDGATTEMINFKLGT